MERKKQTIDSLLAAMKKYTEESHYHRRSIDRYKGQCLKLKEFMKNKKIKYYDSEVGKAYLKSILGDYVYKKLIPKEKTMVCSIEALSKFQENGHFIKGYRTFKKKEPRGNIDKIIKGFIKHKEEVFNLSAKTIKNYVFFLNNFSQHLKKRKISHICNIGITDIMSYISQMNPNLPANRHASLGILRIFFKYLYDQYVVDVDYSTRIPKDNYRQQSGLPSVFTTEEIEALLKSIDRSSRKGKRDYAAILLATKLGLRASDICELKFENINWEHNIISINQSKTGNPLELPLLPEIGNAIIDYLKYGRPIVEGNHCFITASPPYNKLYPDRLGELVRGYFKLARINCLNRKHSTHSLRHSFASTLLRDKVPLPIISGVLGHSSGQSTMSYLRIDITSLKKCALEVPPMPYRFYEKKGGNYHE